MRLSLRGTLRLAIGAVGFADAQDAPLTGEEMNSAIAVEAVSVPMPGEFFAAINKIERPNWSQLARQFPPATTTNRAQGALNLGTRVADGFIAVEAQDGQQVKNIGKDIIDLSKALGVSQSILARGNSISDFAENNDWSALKEELEATENEVKLQMGEQKDTDLITLVTAGAWLRGTQAASGMIASAYTPEAASLLRQPAIAGYLVALIDSLPEKLKSDDLVKTVHGGIAEIQTLTAPSEVPTAETVGKVSKISSDVVEAISGPAPSPAP